MFKHLLIPIDGTDIAERAIQAGIDLAKQLNARITAFIAEPPAPVPATERAALHYLRDVELHNHRTAEHAQGVLSNFERRATQAQVPFVGVHAQPYRVDQAIADTARECGCDMIVMVTHGRGLFGELLFGSRTKGVMALTKLPLLVLH